MTEIQLRKGEPVALFMNNCPQYVMAHYGVQKLGAIVCPCGPLFKEHELQYQLEDLRTRVIAIRSTPSFAAAVSHPSTQKSTSLPWVIARYWRR